MKKTIIYICFTILSGSLFAQGLKPIVLNQPDLKRGLPVMEALSLRASASEFTGTKLSLQDLSDLLWAANGVNRKEMSKRTAPSAMNAQDIDVYLFTEEGVYIYDAQNHALNPVVSGDQRGLAAGRQEEFAKAAAILVMVSDLSKFKSGDDKMKLGLAAYDAGIVSQNISVFCASVGFNTRPRATMDIEKMRSVLQLKETQFPMLNNPVSYK
jgi:SagB-type dehydrogenase family enzyme